MSGLAAARAAYEAYCDAAGEQAAWDKLDDVERTTWRAVAAATEHSRAPSGDAKPPRADETRGRVRRYDGGE